jgi:hypothetical protein
MTNSKMNEAARRALWLVGFVLLGCSKDNAKSGSDRTGQHPADRGVEAGKGTRVSSFFVSSDTSKTGNLGGLSGADARCGRLATAATLPTHTWKAYLSVEKGDDGEPVNARDRIGSGPWFNVKGVEVAADLDTLHSRTGDADVFVDEHGEKIPGQWAGSPQPVAHDVLTGSASDGSLMAGKTCADWTSEAATDMAQVGHSDGLGPNMNPNPPYSSWNSAHANGGCNDTAPLGGAGRIYCFAFAAE